jgi:hypothetical protein
MSSQATQFLIEAGGHLRDLRRSWGYDTAASFARAIGYPVAKYQRHERIYPSSLATGGELFYAIERVGPLTSNWLLLHRPEWAGPLHARAALRVRNGVSEEKAIDAYRQEFTAAMWKREERQEG